MKGNGVSIHSPVWPHSVERLRSASLMRSRKTGESKRCASSEVILM